MLNLKKNPYFISLIKVLSYFRRLFKPFLGTRIPSHRISRALQVESLQFEQDKAALLIFKRRSSQYYFEKLEVSLGSKIKRGDILAQDLIESQLLRASSDGVVKSIDAYQIEIEATFPSDYRDNIITPLLANIADMGVQEAVNAIFTSLSRDKIINQVREAGVLGLGGAAYPAYLKLHSPRIHRLIVNAVECEPYLISDDALMQSYAREVVLGALIVHRALFNQFTIIAIDSEKKHAIAEIKKILAELESVKFSSFHHIQIQEVTGGYPHGSAKQLVEKIFNKQIERGKHLEDEGFLSMNVATIFSVYQAVIHGQPQLDRVVTLAKEGGDSKAVLLPFGMRITDILSANFLATNLYNFSYEASNRDEKRACFLGGIMMGESLREDSIISPSVSGVLYLSLEEKEEQPCINCANCVSVCPMYLEPQKLLLFSRKIGTIDEAKREAKLNQYSLDRCIECAACSFICPSNIPLVSYYKSAKAHLIQKEQKRKNSDISRTRHENKVLRLENQRKERLARQAAVSNQNTQQKPNESNLDKNGKKNESLAQKIQIDQITKQIDKLKNNLSIVKKNKNTHQEQEIVKQVSDLENKKKSFYKDSKNKEE